MAAVAPANEFIIELLQSEQFFGQVDGAGEHPGLMLASMYETQTETYDQVVAGIEGRIHEILNKNSWMMGRIKYFPATKEAKARLAAVVNPATCNPADYITREQHDGVLFASPMNYSEVVKYMEKNHYIGALNTLWDRPKYGPAKPYCNFGIINNAAKTRACVFFAVNHSMFDAATMYNVWKMLDLKVPVIALEPTRFQDFEGKLGTELSLLPQGMTLEAWYGALFGGYVPALIMKGIAQWFKRCKFQQHCVQFNMAEIENQKQQFNTGSSWVSSNDVLTSWIQKLIPKARNISMGINCRNRIAGITNEHAGNYIQTGLLKHEDLKTPQTVRDWLKQRLVPGNGATIPTFSEFRKYIGGVHTSWATFYHHVEFDGFRQMTHFPVISTANDGMGGLAGCEFDMFTYKCGPNKLGALMTTKRKEITMENLLKHAIIESELKCE